VKITKSIKECELLPQIKRLANDFQELTRTTMKLALNTAKENKDKVKKNVKETSIILKETMAKLRKVWK